jgi:hypothetical protein
MINVALCLPAFVFAANTIMQRWRWTTAGVYAMFLIPIIPNALMFGQVDVNGEAYYQQAQAFVGAMASSPLLATTPDWVQPNASFVGMPDMTVGWIKKAKQEGKLQSDFPVLGPGAKSQLPVRFGVSVIDGAHVDKPCQTYTTPIEVKPNVGDQWEYRGAMNISTQKDGKRTSFPVVYSDAFEQNTLQIATPNLDLLIEPVSSGSFELCK